MLCVVIGTGSSARASEPVRYVLSAGSTIFNLCPACPAKGSQPQALVGSFVLTPVPLVATRRIDALSDVALESASYHISGSGFFQFPAVGQLGMVVHGHINNEDVELRATRRQFNENGGFTVILTTGRDSSARYLIVLMAKPEAAPSATPPSSSTADCHASRAAPVLDADFDGISDACDACPDTAGVEPVNRDGCTIAQTCPCDGPPEGGAWKRGAYGRCVARAIREMRRDGIVSRSQAVDLMRQALHSGCGQTVLAMAIF